MCPRSELGRLVQLPNHARVPERVGLEIRQLVELVDAHVRRAEDLVERRIVDDSLFHLTESMLREEARLEGEAEQTVKAERVGTLNELAEDARTKAQAASIRMNRDRADLAEITSEDVKCTASNNLAIRSLSDDKLLNRLVEPDPFFPKNTTIKHVGLDEVFDGDDIARRCCANGELLHGTRVGHKNARHASVVQHISPRRQERDPDLSTLDEQLVQHATGRAF